MAETGLLKPALKAIAEDIDKSFDLLLPVPGDPRDRLVEAMRYATIGGDEWGSARHVDEQLAAAAPQCIFGILEPEQREIKGWHAAKFCGLVEWNDCHAGMLEVVIQRRDAD